MIARKRSEDCKTVEAPEASAFADVSVDTKEFELKYIVVVIGNTVNDVILFSRASKMLQNIRFNKAVGKIRFVVLLLIRYCVSILHCIFILTY